MPEANVKLLEVTGLTVSFPQERGRVSVLRGLNLTVAPGETVALVGESGSGKSVTALAITRLIDYSGGRIDAGSVMFRQRSGEVLDLVQLGQDAMRRLRGPGIAMVFQEPMTSLNPVLRVGDQIAEAVMLHQGLGAAASLAEARRMLERVRIPDAERQLSRYPFQLSGGMRQRVMIAMALACRPVLLIADEPTTALDVTVQAQVLRLMRGLQREFGMALLFITHDMGVVAEIADRVVVMRGGEKVEENEAIPLFGSPRQPYTRALLSA
ncbi:MAG: ABC transporter ATP-binding protein, partial [Acetobacteraceae bacterium]